MQRRVKSAALSNLSIYYTWGNIKSYYKNNKVKIPVPTWTDKFELLDGLYYISDIKEYFECFIKIHKILTNKSPLKIHINKIEKNVGII